jgi:hypothetical protein
VHEVQLGWCNLLVKCFRSVAKYVCVFSPGVVCTDGAVVLANYVCVFGPCVVCTDGGVTLVKYVCVFASVLSTRKYSSVRRLLLLMEFVSLKYY